MNQQVFSWGGLSALTLSVRKEKTTDLTWAWTTSSRFFKNNIFTGHFFNTVQSLGGFCCILGQKESFLTVFGQSLHVLHAEDPPAPPQSRNMLIWKDFISLSVADRKKWVQKHQAHSDSLQKCQFVLTFELNCSLTMTVTFCLFLWCWLRFHSCSTKTQCKDSSPLGSYSSQTL